MGELNYSNHQSFIKAHLNKFNSLSVREIELKNVVQDFTKKEISQVIDPAFLLNRDVWAKKVDSRKKSNKKYLLFYHLKHSEEASSLVRKIALERKIRIIEIRGGASPFVNYFRVKNMVAPLDYIELFRDASFVVSTSFHGVVFSLIFKKDFYAIGMGKNAGRVINLLETLNLQERYLNSFDTETYDFIKNASPINFEIIDKLLEEQICESKRYLLDAITK
jgi:polysaccharide pyruvyl transferase WcaK-like protein